MLEAIYRMCRAPSEGSVSPEKRRRIERLAMDAVMEAERALGYVPRDVGDAKLGYDVESSIPGTGRLRQIEVKGRVSDARTVTITANEIRVSLNRPEEYILAIVQVEDGAALPPRYIRRPFHTPPDFGATSVNYDLAELLEYAYSPGQDV